METTTDTTQSPARCQQPIVLLGVSLTAFESSVFRQFARQHKPGWHDHHVQLEGDKQLPVIAAGHRLMKKGVLVKHRACHWYLSDLGREMAVEWQQQNSSVKLTHPETKPKDHE